MAEREALAPGDLERGEQADICQNHIGGLLHLARGSRMDICLSVPRLGRRVTKWRRFEDKLLRRLMGYLPNIEQIGRSGTK